MELQRCFRAFQNQAVLPWPSTDIATLSSWGCVVAEGSNISFHIVYYILFQVFFLKFNSG